MEDSPCFHLLKKKPQKPVDKTLLTLMPMLLLLGLLTLFSATYYKAQDGGDALSEVKKQLFGAGVGAVLMLFTMRMPYAFWGKPKVVLTGIGVKISLQAFIKMGVAAGIVLIISRSCTGNPT